MAVCRWEYREMNRSHIAEYDPNASGRSVLTIGSMASQIGSWHSSPAGSRLGSPANHCGFHEVDTPQTNATLSLSLCVRARARVCYVCVACTRAAARD